MRSVIICVDDEKVLLGILSGQLEEWFGKNYRIEKTQDPEEGLSILKKYVDSGVDVSVFLSDYIMPVMKGDVLLTKVKEISPETKRIMMTGYAAAEGMINAINKAAIYRYVLKPWDSKDLVLTLLEAIKSFEQNKNANELKIRYENLYHKYEKLYNKKDEHYKSLLSVISKASDARTAVSPEHSEEVVRVCDIIGRDMMLRPEQLKNLIEAAYLHDLGKLLLNENDILKINTADKYSEQLLTVRVMQSSYAESILEASGDFDDIIPIVKYQFEYFSGGGPFGLRGNAIPVEARILHIANLYCSYKIMFMNMTGEVINAKLEKTMLKYTDPAIVVRFIDRINQMYPKR